MKKREEQGAVTASHGREIFCADTAVLRGTHGACVYGCRRILHYAPERICLSLGKRRITVRGEGLLCTSFSAGCVTVAGEIEGIRYCRDACDGCREEERG